MIQAASPVLRDTILTLPNLWPTCPKLPASAAAIMAALHLQDPRLDGLGRLTERQWREALDFCDHSRLTLLLRDTARDAMPHWVRERTDDNAARNTERLRRLEKLYRTLAGELATADLEFVALKGITHGALFGVRPESRMQYDIDLFAPPEHVQAARDVLLALGYEAIEGIDPFPTDHLPAMVRKTVWEWRGDYFDLDIPTPIELHFQFWNERTERLRAPGTDEFWSRRKRRTIAGIDLGTLHPADALAYAALHLLKHVLRGSSHASHVYEIAAFLDSRAEDETFWNEWAALHSPELRRLEAVAFRLAHEWFGCRLAPLVGEELSQLPAATRAWFAEFSLSPVRSIFDSNKDELWLHWTLLDSRRDAWSVARRRLLPSSLPPLASSSYVPEGERTWLWHARRSLRYAARVGSRLLHHALALPRTMASGARWWWRTRGLR